MEPVQGLLRRRGLAPELVPELLRLRQSQLFLVTRPRGKPPRPAEPSFLNHPRRFALYLYHWLYNRYTPILAPAGERGGGRAGSTVHRVGFRGSSATQISTYKRNRQPCRRTVPIRAPRFRRLSFDRPWWVQHFIPHILVTDHRLMAHCHRCRRCASRQLTPNCSRHTRLRRRRIRENIRESESRHESNIPPR